MSRTEHLDLTGATWIRSSYSGNGGSCVEVARWVKSSYSDNGGTCVEVAPGLPGVRPVRDSKDPEGPVLLFPIAAWRSFVAATVAGEFGEV
ncbi:DUF397 domain-containing protein [Kitasatospora sp. NPDC089509]|uniref:DUF397 domain-containing protein n=1 Tax=Kitasatospora sp. NPDC089509 TaxID=3364079 RepID=UPI00382292C7